MRSFNVILWIVFAIAGCTTVQNAALEQKANRALSPLTEAYQFSFSRAAMTTPVIQQIREDLAWHRKNDVLMSRHDILATDFVIHVEVNPCTKKELFDDKTVNSEVRRSIDNPTSAFEVKVDLVNPNNAVNDPSDCAKPIRLSGWRINYFLYRVHSNKSRLEAHERAKGGQRVPYSEYLVIKKVAPAAAESMRLKLLKDDSDIDLNVYK